MSTIKEVKMPQATFTLGDKQRRIKFDLNAFGELEERFGSVEAAFEAFEAGSIKAIKYVLWAGLIHNEAVVDEDTGDVIKYKITPHMVGSWIEPHTIKEIAAELYSQLASSLPADKKAELDAKLAEADKKAGIDKKADAGLKNDQTAQS